MIHRKKQTTPDEISMTMNTTAVYGVSHCLHCLIGEYAGYDIPVLSTGILIGRDPAVCHLIFGNTPEVSRYHCRVTYSSRTGYFVVTDLNSTNGVYTEDGQRLSPGEKLVLGPGQRFRLCGEQILFETLLQQPSDGAL